jgi:chemotaxis signal transduction protein
MNSNLGKPKTQARACLFELDEVLFAVPGQYTRQIHTLETITRVPRAPQDLLGLFAVRGQIFPLVRIERALGLKTNTSEAKLAVQIEFEAKHMAFVIDTVVGFDNVRAFFGFEFGTGVGGGAGCECFGCRQIGAVVGGTN